MSSAELKKLKTKQEHNNNNKNKKTCVFGLTRIN